MSSKRRHLRRESQGGKVDPDSLPGKYDTRVFIGGNYDQIVDLRRIQNIVKKVAPNLDPILPRDDVAVPIASVHSWDLRILHNCRYAIFDVSTPAGELMEIERIRDYGTDALLVYQSREQHGEAFDHLTRMIRTCGLDLRGYHDDESLKTIVSTFLGSDRPINEAMEVYCRLVGYSFQEIYSSHSIDADGFATGIEEYRGLKVKGDKPLSEVGVHKYQISCGEITDAKFTPVKPRGKRLQWDEIRGESRVWEGKILINPPLESGEEATYRLTIKTRHAFCLTKEEFQKLYPDDPSAAEEYERKITHPTERTHLEIKLFQGYPFSPRMEVYYGTHLDSEASRSATNSLECPKSTNKAISKIDWPKPGHAYKLLWDLPDRTGRR